MSGNILDLFVKEKPRFFKSKFNLIKSLLIKNIFVYYSVIKEWKKTRLKSIISEKKNSETG